MDPYASWKLQASRMGPSTNPQQDQLKEFNLDANWGTKNIEIGFLDAKKMEELPRPAADEIRRLSKLTGVNVSVHGPLDDPAGVDEKGFSEYKRKSAVNKYFQAMKVAEQTGGTATPVVFHASNFLPGEIHTKNGSGSQSESIGVVDRSNGKLVNVLEGEIKETLDTKGPWSPKEQLKSLNVSKWSENIRKLAKERAELNKIEELRNQNIRGKPMGRALKEDIRWSNGVINSFKGHLKSQIDDLYQDFSKFGPKKEDLSKIKDKYERAYFKSMLNDKDKYLKRHRDIYKKVNDINRKAYDYYQKGKHSDAMVLVTKQEELLREDLDNWQEFFNNTLRDDRLIPKKFTSSEDFSRDKIANTFAETAFKSYNAFNKNSPVIMIENPPAPGAFSNAKEHKRLVEEARNKLVEISKKRGKPISHKQASNLIKATFDIAHYGMWKQYGFKDEDITKMAEEVSDVVGHVHLSDNFGSADSHLPPGWGNLPQKDVIKALKKKGIDPRMIIEAGGAEGLGYNPYLQSLEHFDSGIYSWNSQSSWSDTGDYFFGSSMYNVPGSPMPDIHTREYGSGFSGLPPASNPNGKSKNNLSGTPYS